MFVVARQNINKYGAITLINLQNQLAYIWEAVGRSVFIVLILFVFVQLWTAVYENRGTAEIAGLSLSATIWYFLIAEMVELGKFRHAQRISEEVKDGSIAYALVRPYNFLTYHFFNGLGETVVKMVLIFALGLPIVLTYAGRPDIKVQHLPWVALIFALALVLDFVMASAIGLLIPVDFLPQPLQQIARVLPFAQTTYAPAKLFVAFTWPQFAQVLGLQIFWIAIMGALLIRQYRWGARRLSINGG
jgi:ABC-2 type transport system permease protein